MVGVEAFGRQQAIDAALVRLGRLGVPRGFRPGSGRSLLGA